MSNFFLRQGGGDFSQSRGDAKSRPRNQERLSPGMAFSSDFIAMRDRENTP
jgi:hypothetical protein